MPTDFALPVLQNADGINDSTLADLHDIFHQSRDAGELVDKIQAFGVPEQIKQKLISAKQESQGPIEKGFVVIDRLGGIDAAEQHATIAKALINLATRDKGNESE